MLLVFTLVFIPILCCMLVWAAVTAYRLLRPEEVEAFIEDPALLHLEAFEVQAPVPVGVREIREDQRRARHLHIRYYYTQGYSHGLPDLWLDQLWDRRN